MKNQIKGSKKDLLINFVIDRSGSMSGFERATINGFNSLIEENLKQEGATYVSLTLFDNLLDVRSVARDAKSLPKLGTAENPYFTRGSTALYDAVGASIVGVKEWLRNNKWFRGKVLTVIWTDGAENASSEYTLGQINRLIETQQGKGWTFQFMGTGEAGWLTSRGFTAIPAAARVHVPQDEFFVGRSYTSMAASTNSLRSTGNWNYTQESLG